MVLNSSSRILTSREANSDKLTTYLNQSYKYFWVAYMAANKKKQSFYYFNDLKISGIYLADANYYFSRKITSIQDLFFLDVNVFNGINSISKKNGCKYLFDTIVDILNKLNYKIEEVYENKETEGNMIIVLRAKKGTIEKIINGKYSELLGENDYELLDDNIRHLNACKESENTHLQAIHHAYFAVMNKNSKTTTYRDYFCKLLSKKMGTIAPPSTTFFEADFKPKLKDEVLNYSDDFEYFVGLKNII